MDFYLSSRGFGKKEAEFKKLFPKNKKALFIQNAMDDPKYTKRAEKMRKHYLEDLYGMGLEVEWLDLKKYFGKKRALEKKVKSAGVIWVSGGNTFILRQAMKLSGFDKILQKLSKKSGLLYGGASAGACILGSNLKGLDLWDSIKENPYHTKTIWEGLGILDYMILPHYKSRKKKHARKSEKIAKYYIKNRILFKTLKDGEAIIIRNGKERLLQ